MALDGALFVDLDELEQHLAGERLPALVQVAVRILGEPGDRAAVNGFICTIAVDSIEDTERAVPEAGGEQVLDRMEVPDVGQLAYFKDTEGNVMGLWETTS